jgi:hypothetical protein
MQPGWPHREFDDPIAIMLSFLVRVYAIEFVIYTLYTRYIHAIYTLSGHAIYMLSGYAIYTIAGYAID